MRSALEIIVESAAAYSIASVVYATILGLTRIHTWAFLAYFYAETFFTAIAVSFLDSSFSLPSSLIGQNFAPAFIMLRVALGRIDFDSGGKSVRGSDVSTLRYNHHSVTEPEFSISKSRATDSTLNDSTLSERGASSDLPTKSYRRSTNDFNF
jgi:hypothetical protein